MDKYNDGSILWRDEDGFFHREDGPAQVDAEGMRQWWQDGKRHRTDGPAVIWENGTLEWYQYGKRHREDGPAVIHYNGDVEYWIHNKQVEPFEGVYDAKSSKAA